jgi:hypothetical protein
MTRRLSLERTLAMLLSYSALAGSGAGCASEVSDDARDVDDSGVAAAELVAAQAGRGSPGRPGGSGGGYAACMNGCWRSHRYCEAHQDIDCAHQLGQCLEYCESTYDPQWSAVRQ